MGVLTRSHFIAAKPGVGRIRADVAASSLLPE